MASTRHPSRLRRLLSSVRALAFGLGLSAACVQAAETDISVNRFYNPNAPEAASTRRLIELMREDPDIRIRRWGGISLPGGGFKAPLMMSLAGRTAPDIGEAWFHIIQQEIAQGFLHPLNEWIGDDRDGDGWISDEEARWPGWKEIPELWRRVATVDGKVYGIPRADSNYLAMLFRTDMARAAGLNPNAPPQTWDELIYWCQRLTDTGREVPGVRVARGQRGMALMPYGFMWLPWMQSAGGDPIVQVRASPATGEEFAFAPDAVSFVTPAGEDLADAVPQWRANFASPAGVRAAGLYHQLRWMKWLADPVTGEPVALSEADLRAGRVLAAEGREIRFAPGEVAVGVARGLVGQRGETEMDLLARGDVAMLTWFVSDIAEFGRASGINPDLLSWFPFPAAPGPEGRRVVQYQNNFVVMYEGVARRPKEERDRIWKTMTAIADVRARDHIIRERVLSGLARFVNPADLDRLGYEEYLRDIPENIRRTFDGIERGDIRKFTEPWMGFWLSMDMALNREVVSLIAAESGEAFDYAAALREVERKANSGVMFGLPRSVLDRHRPAARAIFSGMAGFIILCVVLIVRAYRTQGKSRASTRNVFNPWLAWGLVLPAISLITAWNYYPLLRGLVMAFQDYRITGDSTWVGLDNFITLALDTSFWRSLGTTVRFVFLNMMLAFLAPIVLAILLTEVPRFKIFYRTLFFLPQMTSGLVIALLWKLMYDPTPQGFFNQLITLANRLPFVAIASQTWLQDPKLAMICCVVPTVWASMGMASLIYLAAMHSIPEDFYEAADLDGAGIFAKLRHITIPVILPLIIINFIGTFIGTFQNMGNIFLMTFGGPGEATMVLGLRIWIEAYNNLRFSMATGMAWVLGSLLIGFTYFQIKILSRVEYRRAKE